MDELVHECGIAALYHRPNAVPSPLAPDENPNEITRLMPRMLLDLQNRGQLAAGFSSFNPQRDQLLDTYKQLGQVTEAFRLNHPAKANSIQEDYAGHAAIGHVRYATCGENRRSYAQPFERRHGCKWKWFCLGFNGQLANYQDLRQELMSLSEYHLTRQADTEVIMHFIAHELRGDRVPDLVDVFSRLSQKFDGAYNIVFLNALGDMVILRDPKGIRPLCYADDGSLFGAASESVALANLGFSNIRALEPGELILIQRGEITRHRYAPVQRSAHCFFEWIYFANVASTLDERSVYLSRAALGKELARRERERGLVPLDEDTIVVPVPDTGKAAADAMAHELGVPAVEGLMRNRYVGRTFIDANNRSEKVRFKFTPLPEVLDGKRVLLVEDSIVRSTTLQVLLGYIRDRGAAREIHVRVACPPILAPCFYGIDMSTVDELFAPRFLHGNTPTDEELDQMARELGADSLDYLPVASVARCIGLPCERLCQACVTGEYPTAAGRTLYQKALSDPAPRNGRLIDREPEEDLLPLASKARS